MGWLLLRSLGTLVAFQVLALAVAAAGRRRHATAMAAALLAALAAAAALWHHLDPVATWAGAVVAGWIVERGVRRGVSGFGRLSVAATVPVVAATLATLLAGDPERAWRDLQAQVDALAGVEAAAPDSVAAPEDRLRRERTQEMARKAARWAVRLLPAEIAVFAWLQVLIVVAAVRRIVGGAGVRMALPPPSRWQVPFAWIWGLAAGLGLVALRHPWAAIAGANIIALSATVLAVQGAAVMLSAIERSPSPLMRALLLATLGLAAWPVFGVGLALLGAADGWVDFRRLRSLPDGS